MRTLVYNWDLLSNLVQRDISIHYRRSFLGIIWSQVNPLLTLLIFSFVFQTLVPLNIPNYPAYVFTGLLVWNWFSISLTSVNYSLLNSRDLVRKPQFPVEMLVVVSVSANFVNLLLASPVLFGLLLINNIVPNWTLIFLIVIIAEQFFFTLGLALIISAANVFFSDVSHFVGVLVTVWFYLTPVFYRPSTKNDYSFVVNWSPMFHLINAYRKVLLNGEVPDLITLLWLAPVSLITFGLGLAFFRRLKYSFVDQL